MLNLLELIIMLKPRRLKMRTLKGMVFALSLVVLGLSNVYAEQPSNLEPIDEITPPSKVIEGQPMEPPAVTKRKSAEGDVEEYRINGEMYMVKVTPKSGVPYYLHRDEAQGPWINDGPTPPLSVPHWVLFRF
jgi:hypothetical protein